MTAKIKALKALARHFELLGEPSPRRETVDGPDVSDESFPATLYGGDETLEVVGESHHQDVLWKIVGGRRSEPVRYETHAVLMPEPDNPYDSNAVAVLIDGMHVGYLSREDASAYQPGLLRLIRDSKTGLVALKAEIRGGGKGLMVAVVDFGTGDDFVRSVGVFLKHDPADFGVAPHHSLNRSRHGQSGPGFRTGLSEAIATDLDDESYDLGWYKELSPDDVEAISQLRAKLDTERDPIGRHYMLSELESRLYKGRDAVSSALDEFDAVCRHHDDEMNVIRPALLDKFGAIPVIDTYRQSAIRCKKAKDWSGMRDWADRGIGIYGGDAARPEAVEDLRERLAYAIAKMKSGNTRTRPRTSAVANASASVAKAVETFVCAACGGSFERVRTTGRKPRICPACRARDGATQTQS